MLQLHSRICWDHRKSLFGYFRTPKGVAAIRRRLVACGLSLDDVAQSRAYFEPLR